MSDLPRIISDEPVVVPAIPAVDVQNYPDLYLTELNLSTGNSATEQTISVGFRPYNYDTKQLAQNPMNPMMPFPMYPQKNIHPINVWEEAARSTLFAQAMGAVVYYTTLKYQEETLLAQEQTEEVVVQLAAVRTQMGVTV
jgi:hypothetical protein